MWLLKCWITWYNTLNFDILQTDCYSTKKICDDFHYCEVIMGTIASQITSLTIVYSTVYLGADQRKHQSSASLAFVWGIPQGPVNSLHKWPVTRKMFPFDDVIMMITKMSGVITFMSHYIMQSGTCNGSCHQAAIVEIIILTPSQSCQATLTALKIGYLHGSFWVWDQPIWGGVTM